MEKEITIRSTWSHLPEVPSYVYSQRTSLDFGPYSHTEKWELASTFVCPSCKSSNLWFKHVYTKGIYAKRYLCIECLYSFSELQEENYWTKEDEERAKLLK